MSRYFEILTPPDGLKLPLVVHVPHCSREIPEHFRNQFALTDDELDTEIIAMTDSYTDELFHTTIELGGLMFVNRTSRLVMDPERFPDDEEEPMSMKGMGAIYTKTSDGSRLRRQSFSPEEQSGAMEKLYWPYARALGNVVRECLDRFSRCLIVDAHSFPSKALPYEDNRLVRPSASGTIRTMSLAMSWTNSDPSVQSKGGALLTTRRLQDRTFHLTIIGRSRG